MSVNVFTNPEIASIASLAVAIDSHSNAANGARSGSYLRNAYPKTCDRIVNPDLNDHPTSELRNPEECAAPFLILFDVDSSSLGQKQRLQAQRKHSLRMSNTTTSLPSFIDTASCLCALEASRGSLDNGNQLWRCLGNATADITFGSSGKWFRTEQSESSLAGLGDEPQDWAGYPPDLSTTYVLIQGGLGNLDYVPLAQASPGTLAPPDAKCTGKNNTRASGVYYTQGAAAAASQSSQMGEPSAGGGRQRDVTFLGLLLLLTVMFSVL